MTKISGVFGVLGGVVGGELACKGSLRASLCAISFGLSLGVAGADVHTDALQETVELVPGNISFDEVVFPKIAAVDVPEGIEQFLTVDTIREFVLSDAYGPGAASTREWVASEPVQAMLEALTEGAADPARTMISLPYGTRGVDRSWVDAGLVAPLGNRDVILGVEPRYMRGLMLVHVAAVTDAWVRSQDDDGDAGLQRFVELIWMYRYVMNRSTVPEMDAGIELARVAFEHLRDCVAVHWEDSAYTHDGLTLIASDLDERRIAIRRLVPPVGARIGAEQVLDKAFVPRGGANPQAFGEMMALAEASGQPLRLFNAVAKWAMFASEHAGTNDTQDEIAAVWGDHSLRWSEKWDSEFLADNRSRIEGLGSDYALILETMGQINGLHQKKRLLETESGGARLSLGVIGYRLDNNRWPRALESAQNYVTRVDLSPDWFNYDDLQQRFVQMQFFVPKRDRQSIDARALTVEHQLILLTHLSSAELEALNAERSVDEAEGAASFDYDSAKASVGEELAWLNEYFEWVPSSLVEAADSSSNPSHSRLMDALGADGAAEFASLESEQQALQLRMQSGDVEAQRQLGVLAGQYITLLVDSLGKDSGLSEQDFRAYLIESTVLQSVSTAQAVSPVPVEASLVRSAIEAIFGGGGAGASAEGGLVVSLDDSTFMLYSVGLNGVDDGGAFFGPNEEEILFWPPAVTLEREQGVRSGV